MPPERILEGRLPPQSPEAEKSVLGSMLRDNSVIGDIIHILRTESFYSDAHQKIYQGIIELYDKGHPVDLVMLAENLQQKGQLEDIGRAVYLAELWDSSPTAANGEYYARIVRDRSVTRDLIHVSNEILRDAYDQAQPGDELLESAERRILDIAQKGVIGQTVTLHEALSAAYDRIDARNLGDHQSISGLSTGFIDLDEITAGLQNSELIIVAARPSVGKTAFSLSLVRNIVVNESAAVFFVSLEQSRIELAERMLCAQAYVDSHKMRKGHLSSDDIQKLIEAGGVLRSAQLFIDDSPGQGMLRIAANARRLKLRNNIRLIVIDYLQLIEPDNRRDPRQEQVAQISRRLKFLARELQIPVIALAQVNRASEDRQDHRPRLADLRESGCLSGETLITLADSGRRVPIRELVGQSGFNVWALDEVTYKLKPAEVTNAFCTGRKPVFRLTTRLGRTIRATANHKFRAFAGWQRLDELKEGDRLAMPRLIPATGNHTTMTDAEVALIAHLIGDGCTLPRHTLQYTTREYDLAEIVVKLVKEVFGDRIKPRINPERKWYQVYLSATERLTHGKRNPIAEWFDRLGIFGLRSWEKYVPEEIFCQPKEVIGTFLRHLWATDGCVRMRRDSNAIYPQIYYASSSLRLARDVQHLLLHLGINAVLRTVGQGKKGRDQHHLWINGQQDLLAFAENVGAVGKYKAASLMECHAWASSVHGKTNYDVVPTGVWGRYILPALTRKGLKPAGLAAVMGSRYLTKRGFDHNFSRDYLSRIEQALGGDETLASLSASEVYWDIVTSISPDGEEEVFDLTVPGPENFICGSYLSHNSIEQDADTVMLLHRPDRYEPGQNEGLVEVIVAKQRNGPTGEVNLAYIKQFMRFENFQKQDPFSS